jgi:hypothetical protein
MRSKNCKLKVNICEHTREEVEQTAEFVALFTNYYIIFYRQKGGHDQLFERRNF